MKETSQAFSWRWLSASFAKVNLPLDSPLLLWWMHVCVCVCITKKHRHTPTHRQMETHAQTEKFSESSMQSLCPQAASVKGAGGCWGGGLELLWLTNAPSYFQAPMSRWLINLRTAQGLLLGTMTRSEREKVWKREKQAETRPVEGFSEILYFTD